MIPSLKANNKQLALAFGKIHAVADVRCLNYKSNQCIKHIDVTNATTLG